MKKFFYILIICFCTSSVLFTGCFTEKKYIMNNSSQQYAVISDMFRDEYSVTLFRFGQIVKIASEVNDENDLLYLDGRIDDFLAGSKIFFIESVFSIEKSQLDTIIIPDLQQPIEELFSLIYDYIDNLNYIVEKKDIEAIKSMKNDLENLYTLERNINDDGFNKKNNAGRFTDNINKIKTIITNFKGNIKKYQIGNCQ